MLPIPQDLFSRNRSKLNGLMAPGSILVMRSSPRRIRSGDQFYPFRQQSDFFYLTGINQPESVLVMAPDQPDPGKTERLFIHQPTTRSMLWEGPWLSRDEASSLSGIGQVHWLEELELFLEELIPSATILYQEAAAPVDGYKAIHPGLEIQEASALTTPLRMVKEPEEVAEMRKAADITGAAFKRILGMVRPGVMEYQVEAEICAEFRARGASGHAYEPIVASGKNALILHYVVNRDECRKGEMVLLDFGAEVNNYAADCSRTIPVSGRFSKRQREVYDAVLRVFKFAREKLVPGNRIQEIHDQVGEMWREEHIRLGLYTNKQAEEADPEEPLWRSYFMHGTSHSLGLDVHDPFDRSLPLLPGMVLTCEPAIYIRQEGTGIRIENDILITEKGPVDLLEKVPMEAEEIEQLMGA